MAQMNYRPIFNGVEIYLVLSDKSDRSDVSDKSDVTHDKA